MDFARAAVEAEARERSEAKKRKRFAEGGGVGEGEGAAAPQPRPAGGPVPGEATAREAKARREARRRLDAGAEATEEVALARAEERGGEAAAAGAGQPRPGFTAFNMDEEKEEGEGDNSIGSRPSASSSREDVADDAATSTSSSPKLIHVASSTGAGNDATGDSSQQGDSDKTPAATAALSRLTMKDEGADAPCRLRVLDAQLRLLTQYVEADFSGAALKRRSQDAASYSSYSSRVASRHRGPPSRGSSHSNVSDAAAPRVSSSLLARKGTQQYDSIQEESVSDE